MISQKQFARAQALMVIDKMWLLEMWGVSSIDVFLPYRPMRDIVLETEVHTRSLTGVALDKESRCSL